jgi:phosphopentomutase
MEILKDMTEDPAGGFIFANFCDFDSKWGHRNDYAGFAEGLKAVDRWLPSLISLLSRGDSLFITADHGNDPTTPSTDHSREYVPLICFSPGVKGRPLGTRQSFADIAVTLCDIFEVPCGFPGSSMVEETP